MNDMIVKNVDVMGDSIMAAKDNRNVIWVGVRYICDSLGMTEGQMKRQIKNIKNDMLFQEEGGSNQIPLPTNSGEQEVFCIRNDFIPIWLAKINITEKTRKERPDFAKKLLEYQLKAKDILAEAFTPKLVPPSSVADQIKLLAQGNVEVNQRVDALTERVDKIELDLPVLPDEAHRIQAAVKRRGVTALGGKQSRAYKSQSLRQRLYGNLYANLKYNFSVKRYTEIKRSQCNTAIQIVEKYEPPLFLAQEIEKANNQEG